MSEETMLAIRFVLVVLGFGAGLLSLLIGLLLRHQFNVNKLLFLKIDRQQKAINILKLAALKGDPEGTALFEALARENGDH